MSNITPNTNFSFQNIYASQVRKRQIDLSLSENPLGCSPKINQILQILSISDLVDYPQPNSQDLVSELASNFKLNVESIMVGNGSEALLALIGKVLLGPDSEVILPSLSFPMFKELVGLANSKAIKISMTDSLEIDLSKMQKAITINTNLIIICNPNNPTGMVLSSKDLINFVQSTKTLVLIDEANIEFGGESMISQVNKLPNLLVLRTLSKGFGLAGLRIGFLAGNKNFIRKLKANMPIFPISRLASTIARIAINDDDFIKDTNIFINKQREYLIQKIIKLGFIVLPSQTNNLFIKVTPFFKDGRQCSNKLVSQNVSVVNGAFFGEEGKNFVRISVRNPKINQLFINILSDIVKNRKEKI